MQVVDQIHQILWGAVPAAGREISGRLVSPRSVERMRGQRQKLDMREAHLLDVVRQYGRDLAIAQPTIVVLGYSPPRSEVDFVDRDRRVKRIVAATLRHPRLVVPLVSEIPNNRSGVRWSLRVKRKRIGLVDLIMVVTRYHMVLVDI